MSCHVLCVIHLAKCCEKKCRLALLCAASSTVPLSNYSLTHSLTHSWFVECHLVQSLCSDCSVWKLVKGKGKHLYSATNDNCSCSSAVRHRQSGRAARTQGLAALQPNSHTRSCGLPFNGLYPRNPCNYTDYYSFTTPKGWKAELAWLIDP